MSPVGFESTIPASPRWQTYALDRAATGIDSIIIVALVTEGTVITQSVSRLQND
jgi:hypothetical protein